jgi:hypothetical protein
MAYSETQKIRQTWLWLMTIAAALVSILPIAYEMYQQAVDYGSPFADESLNISVVVVVVIFIALLGLLYVCKLELRIDSDGLNYRFYPFMIKYRHIAPGEILNWQVRKYSPLKEYGGWGIRYSTSRGWAYNVSGNMGLQLELVNGKRILFGTRKPDEINRAMEEFVKTHIV